MTTRAAKRKAFQAQATAETRRQDLKRRKALQGSLDWDPVELSRNGFIRFYFWNHGRHAEPCQDSMISQLQSLSTQLSRSRRTRWIQNTFLFPRMNGSQSDRIWSYFETLLEGTFPILTKENDQNQLKGLTQGPFAIFFSWLMSPYSRISLMIRTCLFDILR
jgi:hypothetical protein